MEQRRAIARSLGSRPRALGLVLALALVALPAATGHVRANAADPNGSPTSAPSPAHTLIVPLVVGNVTVTNCTTAGYNNYNPGGTPPDVGLGGALANGNVITFACNTTLSGPSPYTIVPQNSTTTGAQTITISSGTVSIDGSDGGANDITLSGNNAILIFKVSTGATLTLATLTLAHAQGVIGGAVSVNGTLTVLNSTFSQNVAANGAAIDARNTKGGLVGSITVSGSTFTQNSTTANGGAIESAAQSLTMSNSTFSGNSTLDEGGAVNLFDGAAATIVNDTFSANTAGGAGASGGGALAGDAGSTAASFTVSNSLFSANTASHGGATCSGAVTDNGGNLEYPSNTCGFSVANGDSFGNPNLGPLANNGGPTQTEALLPGSAAIDLSLAATCEAAPVNDVDQRGLPRYAVQRGVCDAGAYDTGGGIVAPLTITGAFPLTRFPAGSARLGFAASNHTLFTGVSLQTFPIGYITFQLGGSVLTVRRPVTIACTSALAAGDHCFGAVGLVNGAPGFVAVPGTATLTLSGLVSTGHGAYRMGDPATVTLTVSVSAAGVITVSAVSVSVNGIPQVTWTAPFPFATSLLIQPSSLFIP